MAGSLLTRGPGSPEPPEACEQTVPVSKRTARKVREKVAPRRAGIRATCRSRSSAMTPKGGGQVRYYLGVDWADQTHAVWVVDEHGTKVAARIVPHTVEGLTECGRELDEWRAQGIELWAAIERPEGRVVDFLLDHGVVVYPVNPKALDRARDRFGQSGAKSDLVRCAGPGRLPADGSSAPLGAAAELGSGPGAETPHGRLPAAHPPADPSDQPADGHAQGVLSAGARGRRVSDCPGEGIPAGLSDAGRGDRADGTPVAAVGARTSADSHPDAGALERPPAAAVARAGPRGARQGPVDAEFGRAARPGRRGRRAVPEGD